MKIIVPVLTICLLNAIPVIGSVPRFDSTPEYGAYPKSLHPEKVAWLLEQVIEKYNHSTTGFTPISGELLVRGLLMAGDVTHNSNYTSLALKIKNKKSSIPVSEFHGIENSQFDLCRQILNLPEKDGKFVISKNLPVELVKQSLDNRTETYRIFQQIKDHKTPGYLDVSLYIFNTTWGINQPVDHMWLDSYRVPVMRLYLALSSCINKDGQFKGAESDVLTDAAFILAASQVYLLTTAMSLPMPFVTTRQYGDDLETQQKLISEMIQPDRDKSISMMRMTTESQLKNLFKGRSGDAMDADRSWYRGAFFAGVMAAWRSTGDDWYLEQVRSLCQRTKCEPGPNAMNDANDLAISQTYLELYEAGKPDGQYQPTQVYLDSLIRNFNPGKVEWSWCDALFMSPPTWARMGKITGDKKYFEHMDKLWWQTSNLIFDKKARLFYRDLTYTRQEYGFQIRERNKQKIFWGRGNGWVMGALCRVLDYLPENFPTRPSYEKMFKGMCTKLLKLQGNDGLWRSSLLDPESYPMGETSSSTFYCYAFAWGVNHGLLESEKFSPAALKAWKALSACVNPVSGRLEYVQLPADSPRSQVYKNSNVEYATGAYLLAGSEILKIIKDYPLN